MTSIGAYTVGVAMLVLGVLGVLGVEEEQMAHGSLLALGGGLALALPTALTGLLDWLDIPKLGRSALSRGRVVKWSRGSQMPCSCPCRVPDGTRGGLW